MRPGRAGRRYGRAMAAAGFSLRDLDRRRDRASVLALDTSFETSSIFEVVATTRTVELREQPLPAPRTKRYLIDEVFEPWARWDTGWVACAGASEAGEVIGFCAVGHEAWHQRLNLWFLYIAPGWRRRGVGRALLARAEAHGRALGATHVWLETSNVNVPGVAAYERLGYALCGADTRYYGRYMPGEAAVYLAKSLDEAAAPPAT